MNDKFNQQLDINSLGLNLNRNLLALMNNNGVSLTVLSRNTGIAIPTIKRLQSDPTTNPTLSTLVPIAQFFGVTVNQLVDGNFNPKDFLGYAENRTNWLKVPIIEWKQALTWPQEKNLSTNAKDILVDMEVGENPYALIVEEEEWPGIPKGSILIINSNLTPINKDYAVIYKENGHLTLKQILLDENKKYLKSLTPGLPTVLFDESHRSLGVLIQIRKNIKN